MSLTTRNFSILTCHRAIIWNVRNDVSTTHGDAMPMMPLQYCRMYPICRNRVLNGFCDTCKRKERRSREQRRVIDDDAKRFYNSAYWRHLRKEKLFDQPFCEWCGSQFNRQVDHIVPREQGGSDELSNLQTLCRSCHSTKTAKCDGGFNNKMSSKRQQSD